MDLIVVKKVTGTPPLSRAGKYHLGRQSAMAYEVKRAGSTHGISASESSTSYLVLSPLVIPLTVAKIQPDSAPPFSCPGALKAILRPGCKGSCRLYKKSLGSLPSAFERLCLLRSLSL